MKRGAFLRFLPAIPAGFLAATKLSAKTKPGRYDVMGIPDSDHSLFADMIEHWSGGIRPLQARVDRLPKTGDAKKFAVVAQHPDGTWHTKTTIMSDCVVAVSPPAKLRGEMAYQLAKRLKELARDWAFLKWGVDWRLHVPNNGMRWS